MNQEFNSIAIRTELKDFFKQCLDIGEYSSYQHLFEDCADLILRKAIMRKNKLSEVYSIGDKQVTDV
jgi:hypothetical protein